MNSSARHQREGRRGSGAGKQEEGKQGGEDEGESWAVEEEEEAEREEEAREWNLLWEAADEANLGAVREEAGE